ncbi:Azospirillum phage Cd, Gp10 [uncultured Caudovirales phage]|uniref:Azospirillum phage Cd, Gp10 n=1 Tax=uncultured Caudovirales phage TaxID=2100421 RepID=A0A6J5NU64_9CAUD|nr:Azospirillum phage Cd, Gp10 [uncultured Caudovirales phage]CAB4167600.1 Azospirillum phage Cd, Gp10 [uncultured Caudovirales phage]
MSDIGHNLVAGEQLQLLVERIERLEGEKKDIAEDIKDVYLEAKSRGFDAKIIRQIIRLRAMDPDARREQRYLVDAYASAIGLDLI